MGFIIVVIAIIAIISIMLSGMTIVSTGNAAIVERLGKYYATLHPGLHIIIPIVDRVATKVPLRIQQQNIKVRTKTNDNVFCDFIIAVQFAVDPNSIEDSYYKLQNPVNQISAYIQDAIRSAVPRLSLDDVFEKKDEISHDVLGNVSAGMQRYGFNIISTLITDINPDAEVMNAMNSINTAQRQRVAAQELAEAQRVTLVTEAKAKAEAAKLEGEGLADQRSAIIEGLGSNMTELQAKGITNEQVMQLLLLTQYMNTIEAIGTTQGNSAIFLPGGADAVNNLSTQLMASLRANAGIDRPKTAGVRTPTPFIDRNHNGIPDNLERPVPPTQQK